MSGDMMPYAVLYVVLGLVVGSFLNVCIDRLPAGQSLWRPPSRCPGCGYLLKPWDMVPVFSYIWLRGRCRRCGAHIPARVLLVEMLTGLLFGFLWWRFAPSIALGVATLFTCILLVLAFIDFEHGLILNVVVYPSLVLGMVLSFTSGWWGAAWALAGGAAGIVAIILIILVFRGGMGWGDSKMAALIGIMTGFPLVMGALLVSIVSGAIVAVWLLASRRRGRRDSMPFGPFLALGGWTMLVYGPQLAGWYTGLFNL